MSTRGFVGYRYKGKIHGWYNHFDSYFGGLGVKILEHVYCKYPWDVIKDFFLNRLILKKDVDNGEVFRGKDWADILGIDWAKDSITLSSPKWEFYKDGLFCEYTYIFDLDKSEKTLMFFEGFMESPSPGYEDWFHESCGTRYYNGYMGELTGEHQLEEAEMLANIIFKPDICYILDTPEDKLPLLLGDKPLDEDGEVDEEAVNLIRSYVEWRLKG